MLAWVYNSSSQKTERKSTPLNVMGLVQGKVFPRSAPSTGFPIKAPKDFKAKAVPNQIVATSASEMRPVYPTLLGSLNHDIGT